MTDELKKKDFVKQLRTPLSINKFRGNDVLARM